MGFTKLIPNSYFAKCRLCFKFYTVDTLPWNSGTGKLPTKYGRLVKSTTMIVDFEIWYPSSSTIVNALKNLSLSSLGLEIKYTDTQSFLSTI